MPRQLLFTNSIVDSETFTNPSSRLHNSTTTIKMTRGSSNNIPVDIGGAAPPTRSTTTPRNNLPRERRRHQHHWSSLLVLACLSLFSTPSVVLSAAETRRHHQPPNLRHHHHHNRNHRSLESEFTGEWNGKWTADDNTSNYGCNGNNCDDDGTGSSSNSKNRSTGMWIDNVNPDSLTPEQIITYVSLGLLTFMVMLFCCVCYPELVFMGLKKLFCGCCGLGDRKGGSAGAGTDEGLDGADYVRQNDTKVKRKSKSSTSDARKSKSKSSTKDVEIV